MPQIKPDVKQYNPRRDTPPGFVRIGNRAVRVASVTPADKAQLRALGRVQAVLDGEWFAHNVWWHEHDIALSCLDTLKRGGTLSPAQLDQIDKYYRRGRPVAFAGHRRGG